MKYVQSTSTSEVYQRFCAISFVPEFPKNQKAGHRNVWLHTIIATDQECDNSQFI